MSAVLVLAVALILAALWWLAQSRARWVTATVLVAVLAPLAGRGCAVAAGGLVLVTAAGTLAAVQLLAGWAVIPAGAR